MGRQSSRIFCYLFALSLDNKRAANRGYAAAGWRRWCGRMTPAQRAERLRKKRECETPGQRAERLRKARECLARKTPGQRAERLRKGAERLVSKIPGPRAE